MSKDIILSKILRKLSFLYVLFGLGIGVGFFIPPTVAMGISIITLIVLLITMFAKLKPTTMNKIVYLLTICLGITMKFSLTHYLGTLGSSTVIMVFSATIIIFVAMGIVGFSSKRDYSSLGKYLFFALLALIIVGVVGIFIVPSTPLVILISALGAVIFTLYTLYDFNQIAKGHVTEEEVTVVAFGLLLDFINLFLDLLRLVEAVK